MEQIQEFSQSTRMNGSYEVSYDFLCVGQTTLEKLTSASATARPKYILLLYILFHYPSGNIALHCTALGYLSSVLNSILNGHKTFGHIQQKYAHRGQNIYLVATNHSILSSIILHCQVLAAGSRSNTFKATEVKRNLMSGMEWVKSAGHGSVLCGQCLWSVGSSLWAITQTSLPGQFHGADPRLGGENRWQTLKLDSSPHYLHLQIWHANKLRLILTISIGYAFELQLSGSKCLVEAPLLPWLQVDS